MLPKGVGCEASQTLEDSGLINDLGQAFGATGLRSTWNPPQHMSIPHVLATTIKYGGKRMNPYFLTV
jgi:hypothetical protein